MSKSKPPYFCFYPADFISDPKVIAMSAAACGAYIRLLCAAWSEAPPGSVPNDDRVLSRLTGMAPDDWQDVRPEVIVAFEEGRDGRLYQKRLRQEYEKVACKFKAQRQNGQKGGRPKNPKETQQKPMGSHARSGSGSESGSPKEKGGGGGEGKRPREPNPIWDAVCEVFGLKPVTEKERRRVGRIVSTLEAKEATPDDIRARVDRYKRAWPDAALTPEALEKHWDYFAVDRARTARDSPGRARHRDPGLYAQAGLPAQNAKRAGDNTADGKGEEQGVDSG